MKNKEIIVTTVSQILHIKESEVLKVLSQESSREIDDIVNGFSKNGSTRKTWEKLFHIAEPGTKEQSFVIRILAKMEERKWEHSKVVAKKLFAVLS